MCTNDSRWRKTKPSIGRRSTTLLDARPFWQVRNPSSIESLKSLFDLPPTNNLVATGTTKKVTTTSKLGSRRSSCIRAAERGINAFPVQSAPSVSGNRRRCSPADSTCQASKVIQILHHTSFLCESDPREDFPTQILLRNTGMQGSGLVMLLPDL